MWGGGRIQVPLKIEVEILITYANANTDYTCKYKYWLQMQVQILITHANANTQQYFKERYLPTVWFILMLDITDADASKPNTADADATEPNADAVIVMWPLWCGTLCL